MMTSNLNHLKLSRPIGPWQNELKINTYYMDTFTVGLKKKKSDSVAMFGTLISSIIIFEGLLVITSAASCSYDDDVSHNYCSNRIPIQYPFWFNSDSDYLFCGYPGFGIKCSRDKNQSAVMNISNHLYYVQNIHYNQTTLRLVDVDISEQECPLPLTNISLDSTTSLNYSNNNNNVYWTIFYNCTSRNRDFADVVVPYRVTCLDNHPNWIGPSYAFPYKEDIPKGFDRYVKCEQSVVLVANDGYSSNYTKVAKSGFDLSWSTSADYICQDCESSGGLCSYRSRKGSFHKCVCGSLKEFATRCPPNLPFHNKTNNKTIPQEGMPNGRLKVIIGVLTGVGVALVGLFLILLVIYRKSFCSFYFSTISYCTKNKLKSSTNMEVLLESYGGLSLQKYTYSDIKKMTVYFKDTLGQGGYGCVFKGTLVDDGRLVAVKVLNESKGNGEEFINEVSTLGRTNHVNVVSLLGFCNEGNKRALVYEFIPNGSLERFIYSESSSSSGSIHLGWEKLYQIAVGIARGLEYLHCRCNTRILHFDIKPHNILLDEDFCPKISDFGLAKLCRTKESVVSMVGTRGTMGYIAPEIGCRNLGGVSHKSDVYSYGMMVLEMIGGRKNLDPNVENMSGIYFPHWIYNQLKQVFREEEVAINKVDGSTEILKDETAKKMIVVALWCIQTHPVDRPSMSKVVEMLEGSNEELQMPPNPSLIPLSASSSSS